MSIKYINLEETSILNCEADFYRRLNGDITGSSFHTRPLYINIICISP